MNKLKNKQGGFLQIIIIIIILVCVLAYFHVSISDAYHWVVNAFHTVFNF